MFAVESISAEFGGRTILDGLSFVVHRGETLGVVGPNGSGKTTLLRIIAGELRPRSGRLGTPPALRVGYLAQGHASDLGRTVADVFPAAFAGDAAAHRLSSLATGIANERDPAAAASLADEYDALLQHIASGPAADVEALRDQLRLRAMPPDTLVSELSGGELTKLGLIDLVAQAPDGLLLDEPTNHLDLVGIEWVEALIDGFAGPVIVVSHDRALLDECAGAILEIDPHSGKGEMFPGNYTDYANEKARREAEAWESFRRQQREERALKRTISAIESRSRNIENRTINFYVRKRAKKVARRATTLKARLNRQVDSAEHLERPNKRPKGFYGGFQTEDAGATRLLTAVNAGISMEGRPLLADVSFVLTKGEKLAISGPNGCGKTTLLRAVLGQHAVASGSLSLSGSATIGYLSQSDDIPPGDGALSAVQLLRRALPMPEADIYNFLHRFLFGHDQVNTPVGALSFGERRRLALARLVLGGANLLLLDEPTNHLDLPSCEAFEAAFAGFEGAALIVTHDRYFIDQFADALLDLGEFGPGARTPRGLSTSG
jgi:ATP-binding cassette, subfamily F, member 3